MSFEQLEFAPPHRFSVGLFEMIVSEHMQYAVDGQQGELVVERASVIGSCLCRDGWADHDIAEQHRADQGRRAADIDIVDRIERKRQHIGRSLLAHVFGVEQGDLVAVDECERQLASAAFGTKGIERQATPSVGVDVDVGLLVTGDDEEQMVAARNGARAQLSFYGSTPAYRPVLESIGYGELQDELNAMSKRGQWLEMAGQIDDALLERIGVVGPRDRIASMVRERCGGWAGRVSLVAPFAPDDELWGDIVAELSRAA